MFRKIALFACLVVGTAVFAESKVAGKAWDAVDPDCTTQKAVKGAAMKATVGVGNRCGVSETAKDVTGIDGKGKEVKKKTKN
jgi:hypothetical protein